MPWLMEENMKENGKAIKCMAQVYTHGMATGSMQASIRMISNMGMERTHGRMAANMKEIGNSVNNMAKEFTVKMDMI